MLKKIALILLIASIFAVLAGCYNAPVRHLTSDVGLLKEGVSTEEDVLIFLGDPDKQQEMEDGSIRWIYEKTDKTVMESIPLLGKHVGTPGVTTVIVTFRNGVVSKLYYNATDPDEMNWEKESSTEKE